jgi:hypothetical protein
VKIQKKSASVMIAKPISVQDLFSDYVHVRNQ